MKDILILITIVLIVIINIWSLITGSGNWFSRLIDIAFLVFISGFVGYFIGKF